MKAPVFSIRCRLSELVALFTAPPKREPTETEKLWQHVQTLPRFEPVYVKKGQYLYQVIDEYTLIVVSLDKNSRGVYRMNGGFQHSLWTLILTGKLKKKGFEIITESEFQDEYTKIQDENNTLHSKHRI